MDKSAFYADAMPGSRGPLAGIRVLEATNYGAGPICGMVLSDLGAESIKCEQPQVGDPIRSWPPYLTGADGKDFWSGIWALTFNRGKRAVTLDFRKPEGQDLFRRLAAHADVVIENFTPGTMARWGLGYADLKAVKPDLIYVSVSGFGQWGPLKDKRGLDPIGQAMGGVMAGTGEPGGRPLRVGFAIADNMSGWMGAMGALAALNFRRRTGRGQWVDASLIDAMLTRSDVKLMGVAHAGYEVKPTGNGTDLGAPLDLFRCADGRWLYIHALYDHLWKRLADVMGRPDLKRKTRAHATGPGATLYSSDLHLMGAANAGYEARRMGNATETGTPFNTYRSADGHWVFINAALDPHWKRLCELMGRQDLAGMSYGERCQRFDEVDGLAAAWAARRSAGDILGALDAAGITCGPVATFDEILAEPHYRARGTVTQMQDPDFGPLTTYGPCPKFSVSRTRIRASAPRMGQHNAEVYGDLGLDPAALDALKAAGVV
jgi:crotonobetainyl-CoA:carnitine CoA-transferase CaiB-like acyl-CoA transferase